MAQIVPTITEETPADFTKRMNMLSEFAERIHIDFSEGVFSPRRLVNVVEAWWPEGLQVDFHMMLKNPETEKETVVSLKPGLVVLHVESDGNLIELISYFKDLGLKVGLAFLPESKVGDHRELVTLVDHALIFGGHLGYQGGQMDKSQIAKIADLRAIKPDLEVGWDGGVNQQNAVWLKENGVDVLNVGKAITAAENPNAAFEALSNAVR